MQKSGYHTIFHIYLIFFLSLCITIFVTLGILFSLITIQKLDGSNVRSDWLKVFTENFKNQIIFIEDTPQIKQTGIVLLQDNKIGLQILNQDGYEIFNYQKSEEFKDTYSNTELLQISNTGQLQNSEITSFIGIVSDNDKDYIYILHFPIRISKITMYLNAERFTSGKTVILFTVTLLFFIVIISGAIYGLWIANSISYLTRSIKDISTRNYSPIYNHSTFEDLYNSLNMLNEEIKNSDEIQMQTEKIRKEWIANITHDLKAPLSPIKGYAEILQQEQLKNKKEYIQYAKIILKNTNYIEKLVDDLKLAYQLDNGVFPVNKHQQNIVRFLKELVIDILNTPEYENRIINFESTIETILYSFDKVLLTRVFWNLITNAFIHGRSNTEVTLQISLSDKILQIFVTDNGKGITKEEIEHLFERYYHGTNNKSTGLGLAIVKNIVEIHGGDIYVYSTPNVGTTFKMEFTLIKVN